MIEDFEAELTGSLTKIGGSLKLTCGSEHHVSQGNIPVPLQIGVRITIKLTNIVLHNSPIFYLTSFRKRLNFWQNK